MAATKNRDTIVLNAQKIREDIQGRSIKDIIKAHYSAQYTDEEIELALNDLQVSASFAADIADSASYDSVDSISNCDDDDAYEDISWDNSMASKFSYVDLSGGRVMIRNYLGKKANAVIPRIIDGKIVSALGEQLFRNRQSLITVKIPNSVTSIGFSAFLGCRNLTSVNIPSGVTKIERWTFKNCSSLTSIEIPDDVTSIGFQAFYECFGLTNINIPNSVKSIGNEAFYHCCSLTDVSIGQKVRKIGRHVFSCCWNLANVTIPRSVKSIGECTFYACKKLKIYCEAANKPIDWDKSWNPNNCPVVWGYKG